MKQTKIFLILYSVVYLIVACSPSSKKVAENDQQNQVEKSEAVKQSARPAHWGYEGDVDPSHWGSLDPVYSKCGDGKHQSPINIIRDNLGEGVKFNLNYKPIPSFHIAHNEHMEEIIDNGHTIQVTVKEGSEITIEGKTYELKQFHFHTPSEHTIDGNYYPMEMHMVHQGSDKSLAVVSVLFTEGEVPNENIDKIIAHIPNSKGDGRHVENTDLDINAALPSDIYAYHYIGSLTTPPCSENVQWLVLRDNIALTPDQIDAFSSKIAKNNRPIQALNDRTVKLDDISFNLD